MMMSVVGFGYSIHIEYAYNISFYCFAMYAVVSMTAYVECSNLSLPLFRRQRECGKIEGKRP